MIISLQSDPPFHFLEKLRHAIKMGGRELLETLKRGKFVIDWKKHQATRAQRVEGWCELLTE